MLASAAGCVPPASLIREASIDSTQCSPPCSAVPVDRVKLAPDAACDSATLPEVSQDSANAPLAASTTSLKATSRSPAEGKSVAPSAGVVEVIAGAGSGSLPLPSNDCPALQAPKVSLAEPAQLKSP